MHQEANIHLELVAGGRCEERHLFLGHMGWLPTVVHLDPVWSVAAQAREIVFVWEYQGTPPYREGETVSVLYNTLCGYRIQNAESVLQVLNSWEVEQK